MSIETKYVYFSLSKRQLQLLLSALVRSVLKISELGDAMSEQQRSEALEIEAVRKMLESLGSGDRATVKVILSEAQFNIVGMAVTTTESSLDTDHALKDAYAELTVVLENASTSRRSASRNEDAVQGIAKV